MESFILNFLISLICSLTNKTKKDDGKIFREEMLQPSINFEKHIQTNLGKKKKRLKEVKQASQSFNIYVHICHFTNRQRAVEGKNIFYSIWTSREDEIYSKTFSSRSYVCRYRLNTQHLLLNWNKLEEYNFQIGIIIFSEGKSRNDKKKFLSAQRKRKWKLLFSVEEIK